VKEALKLPLNRPTTFLLEALPAGAASGSPSRPN